MKLCTIGYTYWLSHQRLESLTEVLKRAGVNLLIDIRLSPCSPNSDPNKQVIAEALRERYFPALEIEDLNLQTREGRNASV